MWHNHDSVKHCHKKFQAIRYQRRYYKNAFNVLPKLLLCTAYSLAYLLRFLRTGFVKPYRDAFLTIITLHSSTFQILDALQASPPAKHPDDLSARAYDGLRYACWSR